MPKKRSKPTLRIVNDYWTCRYRDDAGRHTLTFGHTDKVPRAQAEIELDRALSAPARSQTPRASGLPTVSEVCQKYIEACQSHYVRDDGTQTGEATNILHGLQPLIAILGKMPIGLMRPNHIGEYAEAQAKSKVCRTLINKRIRFILKMLKWAKNRRLIQPMRAQDEDYPVSAFDACLDFEPLARNRPAIDGGTIPKERPPVPPVEDATIEQTVRFLPKTVRDMVELQRLSSMRPSEVCDLRMADVNMKRNPWLYEPRQHKTKHRGKARRIYLGPKARAIIQPFIMRARESYIFRPDDAKADAGGFDVRGGGEKFTTRSYRDAIWRACDRAFPAPEAIAGAYLEWRRAKAKHKAGTGLTPPKELAKRAAAEAQWHRKHRWSPNRLRHTGLSEIVEREMAEAKKRASAVASHSNPKTTEAYLSVSDELAATVMEKAG